MQIITVTGYKGGVAKSTSAIHIATYLSRNYKTILIDGDPNRTSVSWAQRGNLPFTVADERQAMRLIAGHDYAIIDTPARPHSDDLQELAKGCDLLILPTTPDVVSLEPMLAIAADLGDAKYRALITIVPSYPNKEGEAMRDQLIANGIPTFHSMIRRSTAFQKAALAGKPVNQMSGKYRVPWNDYEALGKEIMEVLANE